MGASLDRGFSNPDDIKIHEQIKKVADTLAPELTRLNRALLESTGDMDLYDKCIEQIDLIKREVTNHDALFAFRNIINHMKKATALAKKGSSNQEILWALQEVMAILFKVQSMPS